MARKTRPMAKRTHQHYETQMQHPDTSSSTLVPLYPKNPLKSLQHRYLITAVSLLAPRIQRKIMKICVEDFQMLTDAVRCDQLVKQNNQLVGGWGG